MIDLAALTNAVFVRLATDAEGTALRAVLGAGADSVLVAQDLRKYEQHKESLPRTPFLALRRGAVPSPDQVTWSPVYTWFAYADLLAGYGQIEGLPKLIAEAYAAADLVGVHVGQDTIEVGIGEQRQDQVLGLLVIPVTLVITTI